MSSPDPLRLNETSIASPQSDVDRLTRLVARICDTPIASVLLSDEALKRFQCVVGLHCAELPSVLPFSAEVTRGKGLFVVPDVLEAPLFADLSPVISGRKLRFYAGMPLISMEGTVLGELAVMDHVPRKMTDLQIEALITLAGQIAQHLAPLRHSPLHDLAARQGQTRAALQTCSPARRDSENLFHLMVDSVRDYAIFMLDVDGHVMTWNAGAERFKGYRAEEIVGRHFSAFYPSQDLENGKPAKALEIAVERGRFEDEGWRIRKDGSGFWANVVITALRDETGGLRGFSKVTRDITDRKRFEAQLRESEERFRMIVTEVQDYAIYMLDVHGYVMSWNAGAERFKGYRAEEIIGTHFSHFYPEEDIQNGKPAMEIKESIAAGRFEDEGWRIRKDGSRFWASVVITALHDSTGQLRGFSKVTRDITARKEAEQKVLQLNAELEQRVRERTAQIIAERKDAEEKILMANAQLEDRVRARTAELEDANKELESFSYSVSHDLRAPLRHVQGYAEMLAVATAGQLSEKAQRYLKTISDASADMGQLIDDLLAFSRMGRAEMRRDRVNVDRVVQDAVRDLEIVTQGRHITWNIAPLPEVVGDPSMLKQVFINLIGNAVKYSRRRESATIQIGLAGNANDHAVFFVRDNGAGFDMRYIGKLFGVFQRLHRADEFEGTGIGLAIVRRTVARHGGRTWAEGKVDEGATFYFTLPAAPAV